MLYYNQVSKIGDLYALNFNGTNQYLQSSNVPQITAYNKVTFYFNFFAFTGSNYSLFQEGTSNDMPVHFFRYSTGIFSSYNGIFVDYNGIVTNDWNKVTVTRDFTQNTERVFINGIFVGSRRITNNSNMGAFIRIGWNPYNNYLKSILKEVSISSVIPTDEQIIADHNTDTTQFFDLLQLKTTYPTQIQNNPNKVVSTQGNEFQMINYPTILVKGVDLIKL